MLVDEKVCVFQIQSAKYIIYSGRQTNDANLIIEQTNNSENMKMMNVSTCVAQSGWGDKNEHGKYTSFRSWEVA